MHVAIIGAGLAGLTAARQCQVQGHQVTVYERSSEVSGRMSTRQTELGGFDHGAQYFTTNSGRFTQEVGNWCRLEWAVPWESRLVQLDQGEIIPVHDGVQRYVPIPSMSSLGKHLSKNLEVRLEQRVVSIESHQGKWFLSVKTDTESYTDDYFDAVILALPPDQAAPLVAHHTHFSDLVKSVHLTPCWALMLGFQSALDLPYDGAWVGHSRLGWIARDTSKPDHRAGERWVCHATADWSIEHLEDDHERVKEKLLKAFHEVTGSPVHAIHAVAHRWRYAQARAPLKEAFLWDSQKMIGVCGDWFAAELEGAGRVENAFLSGLALAQEIG